MLCPNCTPNLTATCVVNAAVHVLQVWDTNTFKVALEFTLPGKVYTAASPPSTSGKHHIVQL
jgi:hypothetical protein